MFAERHCSIAKCLHSLWGGYLVCGTRRPCRVVLLFFVTFPGQKRAFRVWLLPRIQPGAFSADITDNAVNRYWIRLTERTVRLTRAQPLKRTVFSWTPEKNGRRARPSSLITFRARAVRQIVLGRVKKTIIMKTNFRFINNVGGIHGDIWIESVRVYRV